jgi:hypothetical protein
MDAAVWGFVGVVVGGVITGFVSVAAEWIRSSKEAALDGAKRQDDRRLSLDHFQRETLLELQDAVNDMARGSALILVEQVRQAGERSRWEHTPVSEDLAEFERGARQRVATLQTRVLDGQVRGLVSNFISAERRMLFAETQSAASRESEEVAEVVGSILDRTGELIRATFRV